MIASNEISQQRMLRHSQIRSLVVKGEVDQAIDEFYTLIKSHGSHVGLLCDLAGCYYELDRYQECWEVVERISKEYQAAEPFLSLDSKRRTALMMAKFFEEMAEPALAIKWLKIALEACENQSDKKWIFANELRILSYFGIKKDLHKKYLAVLELYNSEPSLQIEILHGLYWAEWALFGYKHASDRWLHLLKHDLNIFDQRLVARDFLEISLLSDVKDDNIVLAEAKKVLSTIKDRLDFDNILLDLANKEIQIASTEGLKLSPMMRLRTLVLRLKTKTDVSNQVELLKKYSFLIEGSSPESQDLFKKIQPSVTQENKLAVVLFSSSKTLVCDNPAFKLKLTRSQLNFLICLEKQTYLSIDQLARHLWHSEGDESAYHRLRMMTYKLNEQLSAELCFKPFEIKKEGLFINSRFQIQIKQ